MSSAPISDILPDQLSTTEIPNGSPARAKDLIEARNRQWALQTGFGGVPIAIHTPLTNDTFKIKLRLPPYIDYAWPAVQASCPGTGIVIFTSDSDATYGSRITVETVGSSSSELISGFFFANSTDTSSKSSDEDAVSAPLKCKGSGEGEWVDFELTVEIPSNVTVYEMFLFWYHQTVT